MNLNRWEMKVLARPGARAGRRPEQRIFCARDLDRIARRLGDTVGLGQAVEDLAQERPRQ